jgi:lipoyl(octanoyl) transferase
LSHFAGIVPCGVSETRYGVTSLADLGCAASLSDVDAALYAEFTPLFGASVPIPKFASVCGTSDANFGIKGTPANLRS